MPQTSTPQKTAQKEGANYAWFARAYPPLERAILKTVAYADVFDYPRTLREIHRYLIGYAISLSEIEQALKDSRLVPRYLTQVGDLVTISGREQLVQTRRRRQDAALKLLPKAIKYGRLIGRMPFVRMVALTGALSVRNVEPEADFDYLIVTEAGRLWLCRAGTILLVRLAALRGDTICPNYFLSERALVLQERNLYTAHELVQMVPIYGKDIYTEIRRLNAWTGTVLPNASGMPRERPPDGVKGVSFKALTERFLRTQVGEALESIEMHRKIAKFTRQFPVQNESDFSADWCKGHFDGHGTKTLQAFTKRLHTLEEILAS